MDIPQTEPFPGETLIADGWLYRDLPRLTQEAFNTFLDILGEENARFLTFARYPDKSVRGQFLMSPVGMERLKQHSAKVKASGLSPDFSAADANTNVDVNHPSSNGKPATEDRRSASPSPSSAAGVAAEGAPGGGGVI